MEYILSYLNFGKAFFLIWAITIYHGAQVADCDESDGVARFTHKNDRTLRYKIPMKCIKDYRVAYMIDE
jgi:hypothetical protein